MGIGEGLPLDTGKILVSETLCGLRAWQLPRGVSLWRMSFALGVARL